MTKSDTNSSLREFPKLNLPRVHVDQLTIRALRQTSDFDQEHLTQALGSSETFISGRAYQRNGRKHLAFQFLGRPEPEAENLTLTIRYDATDLVASINPPKSEHRDSEFLDLAESAEGKWHLSCSVDFRFSGVAEDDLWFPLPSQVGGTAESPGAFQIVGVRAVRISDSGSGEVGTSPEYAFTLDLTPSGEVLLDLNFSAVETLDAGLPSKILAQSVAIAHLLVSH